MDILGKSYFWSRVKQQSNGNCEENYSEHFFRKGTEKAEREKRKKEKSKKRGRQKG
jgi:hypothetical protein